MEKEKKNDSILQLKLSIFVKKNGVKTPFLGMKNLTIDACKYFGNGGVSSAILNIFFPDLRNHSNLFAPCPIRVILCTRLTMFTNSNNYYIIPLQPEGCY